MNNIPLWAASACSAFSRFRLCIAPCRLLAMPGLLTMLLLLAALPAQAGPPQKWPVSSEFRAFDDTLTDHGVSANSLPLYMAELAASRDILASASVYLREDKVRDFQGFESLSGKARFVLTLNLVNNVVLETRENACSWSGLDQCLRREVQAAVRVYRELQRKHGVKPGSRILNL